MLLSVDPADNLPPLIMSRALRERGGLGSVYRDARRRTLTRVTRGVFTPTREWEQLRLEGRHLLTMRALAAVRPGVVFSHRSAAIAWGLPIIGAPPALPELLVPLENGARRDQSSIVHRTSESFSVTEVGGLRVTAAARTLLDVARGCPATVSVPMLDAAIRLGAADLSDLRAQLANATHVGQRRARFALDATDPKSGSPGESLSRVQCVAIGLPHAQTQIAFFDHLGKIGETDFWWPELNTIGEFDGFGKYHREEYTSGRSAAEVVYEEKRREDRLRATSTRPIVVRWGWDEARDTRALHALFVGAGIKLPPL